MWMSYKRDEDSCKIIIIRHWLWLLFLKAHKALALISTEPSIFIKIITCLSISNPCTHTQRFDGFACFRRRPSLNYHTCGARMLLIMSVIEQLNLTCWQSSTINYRKTSAYLLRGNSLDSAQDVSRLFIYLFIIRFDVVIHVPFKATTIKNVILFTVKNSDESFIMLAFIYTKCRFDRENDKWSSIATFSTVYKN